MSYVTYLESALDGTRLPANEPHTLHRDRPLWVRYDLESIAHNVTREQFRNRPPTMWRYRELLPVPFQTPVVSLGETMTPLLPCPQLGDQFGLTQLWVKDESRLPTGTFKSRGQALAVTMARHFGIRRLAIPTAGNAGGAMAAYAARAGLEAYVFMPEDTPVINQYECCLAGAKTFLVNGLINDCGRIVKEGKERMGWFDVSTLKEPYRLEGKKTMGLELAEQLDWRLPSCILYPTGGGTGLIGMWKAFQELLSLGWLESEQLPRMVAVQSDGCCPIARAYRAQQRFAEPFVNAHTVASGIRVPQAVGDFMILDAIRASDGRVVTVDETRIREWMQLGVRLEGIPFCPEAAACIGAIEQLREDDWLRPHEQVILFNTGAAQKYPQAMQTELPQLDKRQVDWDLIHNA